MGRFLPDGALGHGRQRGRGLRSEGDTLDNIVGCFPPKLKQAMYAATDAGGLKAGTWNDCAFNRAGKLESGVNIASIDHAAEVFGISSDLVLRFITFWDNMGLEDDKRTSLLANALLKVGLTTPTRNTIVFRSTVFKGTQTKFLEELSKVDSLADMPGFDAEYAKAAAELVGCC